jgi:hypothetical protein
MKNYSFAYYNDKSNEAIDTKPFSSLLDAIEYFSKQKKLSIDDFLKLYKVFDKNNAYTT